MKQRAVSAPASGIDRANAQCPLSVETFQDGAATKHFGLEETVTLMPGRPSLNLPPSSPIFLDFSRFPPDFWLCSLGSWRPDDENGAKNGGNMGKKWVESAIEGLQKKALMRRTWGVVVAAAPGQKKKMPL